MSTETSDDDPARPNGRKPRGRPFPKGNPGRPPGSRNRKSLALEALLDGQAEAITAKVVEMALDGDRVAMRLCFERLISVRTEPPISIGLPKIKSVENAAAAMAAIVAAVAAGDITPSQGAAVSELVTNTIRVMEAEQLLKRIEALEQDRSDE